MTSPVITTLLIIAFLCLSGGISLVSCYSTLPFRYKELFPLIPRRRVFLYCLFSLVAKMSKADGQVSEEEMRLFRQYVRTTLDVTPLEERQAARVFRDARDSSTTFSEEAALFVHYHRDEPGVLFAMLAFLAELAAADGRVVAREYELLRQFADLIAMAPHRFVALMTDTFRGVTVEVPLGSSSDEPRFSEGIPIHQSPPLDAAYRTLGLQPGTSWELIRTTYRTLAKQYHPDRLRARGVPSDSLRASTEQFRACN